MLRLIPPAVVFALCAIGRVAQAQVCDPTGAAEPECGAAQVGVLAGTELDALVAEGHVLMQQPRPLRDDELPWCSGAEDPRCAPLHTSSAPSGSDCAVRGVAAEASPSSLPPQFEQGFTACIGLLSHAGVNHRVERPPRA